MELRPHDLLRLGDPEMLLARAGPFPAWVRQAVVRAPFAVVRRCRRHRGLVPVGLRGLLRSERLALDLPEQAVKERIAPEQLAAGRAWDAASRRHEVPALRSLAAAAPWLDAAGLEWGPTGAVGFELASGAPVLTAESDVDLLIRAGAPLPMPKLRALHRRLAALPVRFDVQIETAAGAVALAELVGGSGSVMLRTSSGPRLVSLPLAAA